MSKCLYCYQELENELKDFHPACAKRFFGKAEAPVLPYSRDNINDLAKESVLSRIAVTGVQSKLSMDVNKGGKDEPDRKIDVVPHTLIRFNDGEMAYLTKRIDRDRNGTKYLMEDLCQISERITLDKYKSSYEKAAKLIKLHSSAPMLDLVNFWEVVVFSWITGNSDMHLKNFSLISRTPSHYVLSQAYDLVNVHLIFPEDDEELALMLDGRKKHITKQNFVRAMASSGLGDKVIEKIFRKLTDVAPKWYDFIDSSFLPTEMKEKYKEEIRTNIGKLQ